MILVLALAACDAREARSQYNRQLEICNVAEGNGLLDAAVQACGEAMRIAEEQNYPPAELSGLLFRLGRLERQQGSWTQAESRLRRSLAIEETSGDTRAVVTRLVELSLVLAGQDHWLEGAELLERSTPFLTDLKGKDCETAANALRGFGFRLKLLGAIEQAARLADTGRSLAKTCFQEPAIR